MENSRHAPAYTCTDLRFQLLPKADAFGESVRYAENPLQLLALAGHEMRSPLTVIQGFAELLQQQVRTDQQLDSSLLLKAIEGINTQSAYLTMLLENLLDISRLEQGRLRLKRGTHDLLSTVQRIVEGFMLTTSRHRFCLVLDGLNIDDGLEACFDEARLTQILNNLLSNALKYSPQGGEIEVGLRHPSSTQALIWVRDQGLGIPANELLHIFRRFHRAHQETQAIEGLGLGLYLVQELIMLHNGHVWVESQEGIGSTFWLSLPLDLSLCPLSTT